MNELEYKRLTAPVDWQAQRAIFTPERRQAADAMKLYMRLSARLNVAIADRDQNSYRRILRVRRHAAERLERRYNSLNPRPALKLDNIYAAPAMPRRQPPPQVIATELVAAA